VGQPLKKWGTREVKDKLEYNIKKSLTEVRCEGYGCAQLAVVCICY
jgi:hypothetical protein